MIQVVLAALALRVLGIMHDLLFGTSFRVLCYHTISNLQRFDQHLEVLKLSSEVLSLGHLLSQKSKQYHLSTKPRVLITFDDADPSVLDLAAPALKSNGMCSALFVVTDWIGTAIEPWWITAHRAWQQDPSLEIEGQRFPSSEVFLTQLKALSDQKRQAFIAQLRAAVRPARNPSWTELGAALVHGMEIGAHSVSHPCLDMCSSDQVRREISDSISSVRQHLGISQVAFALPNGNFNLNALHFAADAQATAVLLFDHLTMPASRLDVAMPVISRLRIDDYASIWRFVFIVSGWHSRIYHLIRRDNPSRAFTNSSCS